MKKAIWKSTFGSLFQTVYGDPDKEAMFLGLLGRGYFPRQLPPPFNTEDFADAVDTLPKKFRDVIIDNTHEKIGQVCKYSLARPGQLRRVFGMPNPAHHYLMSLQSAGAFVDMDFDNKVLSPGYSMSFPVFQEDERNRAFEFATGWDALPTRRLKERAKGRFLVKTDIARFFPSIYTHSIPWAIHGKKIAKKKKHDISLYGNVFDVLMRNSQDGQTLGIPIGPDTSFLISERILLEIDAFIYQKIKGRDISCFHRVDDYEFVCMTRQDCDFCLAVIQEALQEYELELNALKTEILELPQPIQDTEVAVLRKFDLGEDADQRTLLEYYDLAFDCFRKHPKGTLKYAIKRIPHEDFFDESLSDFMVHCMLLEPGVIEAVFTWLAKAEKIDDVDGAKFANCLSHIILEHSILGHTSEVAWAIWGFMLLKREIPIEATDAITNMKDSVVLLLALDARKKGLLKSAKLTGVVKQFLNSDQLYGSHWLLAYEAVRQKWVPKSHRAFIKDDPIFGYFLQEKVNFYDAQDIDEYQETMKTWQPYNPYMKEEGGEDEDEDDPEAPF